MREFWHIAWIALLWGGGGAALAWLVSWPLSRRSHLGALLSIAFVATVASVGAVIGNTRAMFLTNQDEYVTLGLALIAGLLAAGASITAARRFALDTRAVGQAVDALRTGQLPDTDGRRLSGELRGLRSQLEQTAVALAQTRAREHALESSRRELVAWVSHDLRTPLAGLRAMAEALEDGLADSPARYHRQMRMDVERLTGMVDDLFELSRLQAGAPSARADRINLHDLVSDCVAALEPVAVLQGVRLIGTADSAVEIVGSSSELNRALTNLLVNAIRHSAPAGTVSITVAIGEPGHEDVKTAELSVRDHCGGIADDDLDRLFDVGFRGQAARTPVGELGGGAGLGLAITRGIVTAHRGSIAVRNHPDGCEFTVRLPFAS